jgi:hypothetical protein
LPDHWTHKRRGGGRIVFAYVFDLSLLAEHMAAFPFAAAEHEARKNEAKELRRDC